MCDHRDAECADRPAATSAERRRWERYPSAHDTVIIAGESVRHTAVVLNASLSGMGLKMADSTGLATGQIVTIDGLSGEVQAVIRYTTADAGGASYVGVEWCE
jgi:hypothetical protein